MRLKRRSVLKMGCYIGCLKEGKKDEKVFFLQCIENDLSDNIVSDSLCVCLCRIVGSDGGAGSARKNGIGASISERKNRFGWREYEGKSDRQFQAIFRSNFSVNFLDNSIYGFIYGYKTSM
jgi:hypothetical protein